MVRTRSPQYPAIGLKEAVDKAQLVWERDYTQELPREVIASHMGYASLNGKSLGVISAVGKYGLLDGRGDRTRITDLAVKILAHPTGSLERSEAVRDAAMGPALFREIGEKFDGHGVSDQALKSYLLTRGFIQAATKLVIRSLRETEEFVKQETMGYDEGCASEPTETEMQTHPEPLISSPIPPVINAPARVPSVTLSDDGLEISSGIVTTRAQFEKLLKRLRAAGVLLDDNEDDEDLL